MRTRSCRAILFMACSRPPPVPHATESSSRPSVELVGHDPSKLAEKRNVLVDSSAAEGPRARLVRSYGPRCASVVPRRGNVKVSGSPYFASDQAGGWSAIDHGAWSAIADHSSAERGASCDHFLRRSSRSPSTKTCWKSEVGPLGKRRAEVANLPGGLSL